MTTITEACTIQVAENSFVDYDPHFLSIDAAKEMFDHLESVVEWRTVLRTVKTGSYYLPRQQSWMAEENVKAELYQKEPPLPWSEPATRLKQYIEDQLAERDLNVVAVFDYVLLNKYRDGNDKIGWHRDDEADDPAKQTIASLSLGANRSFYMKPRKGSSRQPQYIFPMTPGTLITMRGDTQLHIMHSVPAEPECKEARINMTFRTS